jgi:hypothetical protein
MLMTVENLTSEDLVVGYPIGRTLAPNGDPGSELTLGVSPSDLLVGTDKGKPASKDLALLQQQGKLRVVFADDPNDLSLENESSASDSAVHLKIPIGFALLDAAVLYMVPEGKRLQIEQALWETTVDWTGGVLSAIGLSSSQAPHETKGDLLGGATGDVEADLQAADGVHQGTAGASFTAAPGAVFLDGGSTVLFDRITSVFTAGAGFVHIIGRYVS